MADNPDNWRSRFFDQQDKRVESKDINTVDIILNWKTATSFLEKWVKSGRGFKPQLGPELLLWEEGRTGEAIAWKGQQLERLRRERLEDRNKIKCKPWLASTEQPLTTTEEALMFPGDVYRSQILFKILLKSQWITGGKNMGGARREWTIIE